MEITYTECITNTTATIDLSKSRTDAGKRMAAAYTKKYGKKLNKIGVYNLTRDPGLYHEVRYLIEHIETDDFTKVHATFKKLYPLLSEDWKSALCCGLLCKAKKTEGNYTGKPYIYSHPLAKQIQEANMNNIKSIVKEYFKDGAILEYKETLFDLAN